MGFGTQWKHTENDVQLRAFAAPPHRDFVLLDIELKAVAEELGKAAALQPWVVLGHRHGDRAAPKGPRE